MVGLHDRVNKHLAKGASVQATDGHISVGVPQNAGLLVDRLNLSAAAGPVRPADLSAHCT